MLKSLRSYALPVLWMFAIPALSYWFAGHAEGREDARFLEWVEGEIRKDTDLNPAQQEEALRWYRQTPPSFVCETDDPQYEHYRHNLGDSCDDYVQFLWSRRAALASIVIGVVSVLFALGCALASFVSRPAQYMSFVIGWNVLKVVGALQALLQGACIVFLSYWMTALWLERYSPKLIAAAAVIAALAVWKVLVAIFKQPPGGIDVEGELIEESHAPELWQRIRALCKQLDTAPPDHLVAGIDDNFFVTEGEVRVGDKTLRGRTLFVSLALLRILERTEAEAVLAHEMAHFHGGDTTHGKRMSPMLARFHQYLQALHDGVITIPIFHFMVGYWGLFSLSLGRASREREFTADGTAARLVSANDVARSLIKIGAYASYRGRVEEALFEDDEKHEQMDIALRVAKGFSGYATTEKLHFDLHDSVTPHPFDSHPPLSERLANVSAKIERTQYGAILLTPVSGNWVEVITPASDIEKRLWSAYEERFRAAHELSLAYRYLPSDEEERAHVERFFPPATLKNKYGSVQLDCEKIAHDDWSIGWDDVKTLSIENRWFKRVLELKLKEGMFAKRAIRLEKDDSELINTIARYHGRRESARAQQAAQ